MKDPDLWRRLADHDFPLDDKGETLQTHLEYETKLGTDKTPIAIDEYRRFLYLAAVSNEAAIPSPLLEGIWRMHIKHTRAYFDDFSPRIIRRTIQQAPGQSNVGKDPAYARTLALYRAEFDQTPPPHIWPPQEILRNGVWWSNLTAALLCGLFLVAAVMIRDLTFDLLLVGVVLVVVWVVIEFLIKSSHGYWTLRKRQHDNGYTSGYYQGGNDGDRRDRNDKDENGRGDDSSGDGGSDGGGGGD